ncbi:uncharacterized protein N7498_006349 [Penicillium cinerascens]|uniref:Uncharacterized protein n=1 Tax=Penicillium cinerascens TaxID=70096 RepID=A0A9W9MI25_9EURO|nr:uncharacterized protein N7498_006349 [Penicillium cinerascens]KAJ5201686.1 hypothetical protein N7498_006349 [Penicillium cinerascens]
MKFTYLFAIIGLAGTALAVAAPEPAAGIVERDQEAQANEAATQGQEWGGPGWGGGWGGRGGGWGGGGRGGGWGGRGGGW